MSRAAALKGLFIHGANLFIIINLIPFERKGWIAWPPVPIEHFALWGTADAAPRVDCRGGIR